MDVDEEDDESDSQGLGEADSDDGEFTAQPSLRRALRKKRAELADTAETEEKRLTSRQRALAGSSSN
jgi:hypothetical protein